MLREMCVAKIAGAIVTRSELHYTGSCGVDTTILEAAGLLPWEKVLVANVTTGARLETYLIPEPAGSGTIGIYGSAARHAGVGDEIIVMGFAFLESAEARGFKGPKVIKLRSGNKLP
ncbi:MAG TPA: aspartate 1-decarboxylase [Planctomycetota bacterium]|nr:aspartate 1-decarboxylase [Planctomycetota bacterium]